jgi:hypothetical protein
VRVDQVKMLKKVSLIINMVINYGISLTTILKNPEPLKLTGLHEPTDSEDEHGM